MLTADADDAFVVLVGNMEGYRSGHLLFNKVQTVLGSFILRAADVDVEIVFVEAIKDYLDIACRDLTIGPRTMYSEILLCPMILLIFPFFFPLTNSLCSFASSILTRI